MSARQLARSGSPLRGLLGFPGELFGMGAVLLGDPGVPIGHPRLLGGLGAFELMLRGEVPSLRGVEFGLLAMATGLFGEPFALQLAACARSARDDRDQSKQDERGYYDDDDYQRGGRLPQFPYKRGSSGSRHSSTTTSRRNASTHPLLDQSQHQPRAGDHQDQPDGPDADVGHVPVGGEVEDRPDGGQEDGSPTVIRRPRR